MAISTVYSGKIERLDILRKDGTVDEALVPDVPDEQWIEAYRTMVWMRAFDAKAVKLQRQGRMGTWAPLKGQEAAQAGLAMAMEQLDWFVPSFREHGVMLARGIPGEHIYSYWMGDERGAALPREARTLPPSVPIGSQLLHGAGVGYGLKKKGEAAAAVTCAGDGSTSEGDFHEALNFAGVYGSQTVFFIQNNGWAISLPISKQTASRTLAQKALAYGIEGIQVDGNDVMAVYVAARDALERARRGEGAALIEAVTYRLGDHTTADDASRYRPETEMSVWEERDPIARLGTYLSQRGVWNEELEAEWGEEVARRVEDAVAAAESLEAAEPSEIFDSMYEYLPGHLQEQKAALEKEVSHG